MIYFLYGKISVFQQIIQKSRFTREPKHKFHRQKHKRRCCRQTAIIPGLIHPKKGLFKFQKEVATNSVDIIAINNSM